MAYTFKDFLEKRIAIDATGCWDQFAKRADAAGVKWNAGQRPAGYRNVHDKVYIYQSGGMVGYWEGASPDIPLVPFSDLAPDRPQKGELYIVTDRNDSLFYHTGDVLEFESDDGSDCPWFYNRTTGRKHRIAIYLKCVRKLEPATEPANVGDMIVVLQGRANSANVRRGETLEVLRPWSYDPGEAAVLALAKDGRTWVFRPIHYAIIKRAEPRPAPADKPAEKPSPTYSFADFITKKIAITVKPEEWDRFAGVAGKAGVKWVNGKTFKEYRKPNEALGARDEDTGVTWGWSASDGRPIAAFADLTDAKFAPALAYTFADFLAGRIIVAFRDKAEHDAFCRACDAGGARWEINRAMSTHHYLSPSGYRTRKRSDWLEVDFPHPADGIPTINFYDLTDAKAVAPTQPNPNAALRITITTDGTTTTATLFDGQREIRKGVAKCDPRDKFDFDTGAKLAFDRMTGRNLHRMAMGLDAQKLRGTIDEALVIAARIADQAAIC